MSHDLPCSLCPLKSLMMPKLRKISARRDSERVMSGAPFILLSSLGNCASAASFCCCAAFMQAEARVYLRNLCITIAMLLLYMAGMDSPHFNTDSPPSSGEVSLLRILSAFPPLLRRTSNAARTKFVKLPLCFVKLFTS